ncbi:MAG: 30S ribosome-binding factor RbfA [Alphaproteobacteria bacterium]|nr:30S ribosome-binding factor RbfA [Alphaproteobacteria bacterium]
MARRRDAAEGPWRPDRAEKRSGPSQRQLRVAELIRQALAEVLARDSIRDPLVASATITVTEVVPSPDLKVATCYVMPLAGQDAEEVLARLTRMAPWLSSRVARLVKLKFAPKLRFRLDRSFDEADRIEALLRRPEVSADVARAAGREEDDGA